MRIHYKTKSNPLQLYNEVVQAISALAPVNQQAQVIVESSDSETWISVPDNFTSQAILDGLVAAHAPQAPKPSPNWDAFFNAAMTSPAYGRIALQSSLAKQRTVTRLEILLGKRPTFPTQYQLLKKIWDDAVNGVVPALNAAEITELNQIASQNAMPFRIAANGTLNLELL